MNTTQVKNPPKFIRIRTTLELSGLTRSSLYRKMKEGIFVPTISLGERSCAHIESEVNTMLFAIAAGKNESELKNLVTELVKQRQSAFA